MNKLIAVSALAISVAFASQAFAKNQNGGGFSGPSAQTLITTSADALNAKDDTQVVLTGKIEQNLGDEKYLFRDASGTITLDIDNDEWNGQNIAPEDTVEIRGEVDKGFTKIEVEVDSIVKK